MLYFGSQPVVTHEFTDDYVKSRAGETAASRRFGEANVALGVSGQEVIGAPRRDWRRRSKARL